MKSQFQSNLLNNRLQYKQRTQTARSKTPKGIQRFSKPIDPDKMYQQLEAVIDCQTNNLKIDPLFYSKGRQASCRSLQKKIPTVVFSTPDPCSSSSISVESDLEWESKPELDARLRNKQLIQLLQKSLPGKVVFPNALSAEIVQPFIVMQPLNKRRKLQLAQAEKEERPKMENLLRSNNIDFFKCLNMWQMKHVPVQIDESACVLLNKKQMQREQNYFKLGNAGYKSLYGESNPKRTVLDAIELNRARFEDRKGKKRGIAFGTKGGIETQNRSLRDSGTENLEVFMMSQQIKPSDTMNKGALISTTQVASAEDIQANKIKQKLTKTMLADQKYHNQTKILVSRLHAEDLRIMNKQSKADQFRKALNIPLQKNVMQEAFQNMEKYSQSQDLTVLKRKTGLV